MTVFTGARFPGGRKARAAVLLAAGLLVAGAAGVEARMDLGDPRLFGKNPETIYAIRQPNVFTHNVGLVTCQITNVGIIGNPFINDVSFGWQGGEYLFLAGLWVGAIGADGIPHVSTAVPVELRPSLQPVDTIYPSFEGIPGGTRAGFFDPDDDGDGRINEDFHNGKDDDGDGKVDEDYEAVGQQMFSCQYWDNTPEAQQQLSEHVPLDILISQRSFAWSVPPINEFIGFDFTIRNIGDQRLKDVYVGFFNDADVGPKAHENYWTDDLGAFISIDTTVVDPSQSGICSETTLRMDIAYMYDVPDNGTTAKGGDVDGYSGGMFLGHTTDPAGIKAPKRVGLHTMKFFNAQGAYPEGDPRDDLERYDLLVNGGLPRRNPNKPDDYRYIMAAGPFSELFPEDELTFQVAFAVGKGLDGLIANAVNAQRVYNGRYFDADHDETTGIDGKETCLRILEEGEFFEWDDPCDTLATTIQIKSKECFWVDNDCITEDLDDLSHLCTGIDGKELLVHWVGPTAPPPPLVNTNPVLRAQFKEIRLRGGGPVSNPNLLHYKDPALDTRRHGEVVLQWNNLSELSKDPLTGNKIFSGYKIWRADNWQRPEGSLGPAPTDWMLLAEFSEVPRDGQGGSSPNHIRRITDGTVGPVLDAKGKPDSTDDGIPIYPVGRYTYRDTLGVVAGKVYFYAVTAFGRVETTPPGSTRRTFVELGGLPSAAEVEAVIPVFKPVSACDQVKVVPNPYRQRADWDLIPSERDPTGTKIGFLRMPEAISTLKIYTLAGDLVFSTQHDARFGDGTYYWNLISRNGQNIVTGLYLYTVEYPGGTCTGKFAVIR